MNRFARTWVKAVVVFMVLFCSIWGCNAFATVDPGSIIKKWTFVQFHECLSNGWYNNNLSFEKNSGLVANSIFSDESENLLPLPSYGFYGATMQSMNCSKWFQGGGGLNYGALGFSDLDENTKWTERTKTIDFLEGLGYHYNNEESEGQYFDILGTIETELPGTKGFSSPIRDFNSQWIQVTFENGNLKLKPEGSNIDLYVKVEGTTLTVKAPKNNPYCFNSPDSIEINLKNADDFESVIRLANNTLSFHSTIESNCSDGIYTYTFNGVDTKGEGTFDYDSSKTDEVIQKMSGLSINDLDLKPNEKYHLYRYYLEESIPNNNQQDRLVCVRDISSFNESGLVGPIRLKVDGGGSCDYYANFLEKNPYEIEVWTIDDSQNKKTNIGKIIEWFNENTDTIADEDVIVDENQGVNNGENDGNCYEVGIEGLSWLVCPIINNSVSAIDAIDSMLESWLSFDSSWYNNESGARVAWEYFRNIANVLMIVVLLVIVVSQLTGYGIDNYGIKKMLPKLVVMGILVNLSFYACQLAVDLSNIIGDGLDNFFKGIGQSISSNGPSVGAMVATIVGSLFATVGAGSGAALTIVGIAAVGPAAGIMLIISLVLSLLVALVSVLVFFLSLGARFIVIIVFIAISPVAFVCYILPNTQKLFKKWWDIFKAALLVYPICGALYGISFIIRGIVFGGSGELQFWMAIVAIIAPFFPFLILPELLKDALGALGKVGGVLSTIGNGLRRGIEKGNETVQKTDAYREAFDFAKGRMQLNRADRIKRRGERKGFENMSKGGQQSYLNAVRLGASMDSKEQRDFEDYYSTLDNNKLEDEIAKVGSWASADQSGARRAALLKAMEGKGMENRIFKYLKDNEDGYTDTDKGSARIMSALTGMSNTVLKAYGKKSNGQTYEQFMKNRGSGGMKEYVESKGSEILSGLDDKALTEIRDYSTDGNEIMSNDLLVEGLASINSQDAVSVLDKMAKTRNGLNISGDQYVRFNTSTANMLTDKAIDDANLKNTLSRVSEDISNDSALNSKLKQPSRDALNRATGASNGGGGLIRPVESFGDSTGREHGGTFMSGNSNS